MANEFVVSTGLIIENIPTSSTFAITIGDPDNTGYSLPKEVGGVGHVLFVDSDGKLAFGSTPVGDAAGNTSEIQYNNEGLLTSSSNFTITGGETVSITGSLVVDGLTFDTNIISSNTDIVLTPDEGNVDVSNKKIINLAMPENPSDATNKAYVDGVAAGLDPKESVRVATTAPIGGAYDAEANEFTGSATVIDEIELNDGDRVLVKNQVDPKQNGIYITDGAGTFVRAPDMDGDPIDEISGGNFVFTEVGTQNAGRGWVIVGDGQLTLNEDNILWTQFSEQTVITAGEGLIGTGGYLDVNISGMTTIIKDDKVVVGSTTQQANKVLFGALANTEATWAYVRDIRDVAGNTRLSIGTSSGTNKLNLLAATDITLTTASGNLVLDPAGLVVAPSDYDMTNGVDKAFATKDYVDDRVEQFGSITSGRSLGTGTPIFAGIVEYELGFRSLIEGDNITITYNDTEITIETTLAGSTGNVQYNNGDNILAADNNFTVTASGQVDIATSLDVANITINQNTITSDSNLTLTPAVSTGQVLVPNTYTVTDDYSLTTKTYVEARLDDIDGNNLGATVGSEGLYTGVTDEVLQFKSLVEGNNITLTSDANEITIDVDAGGSDTQIQYNNSGVIAGDTGFFTDGAGNVAINGTLTVGTIISDANILLDPGPSGLVVAPLDYDASYGPDETFVTKRWVEDRFSNADGFNLGETVGREGLFTEIVNDVLQFKSLTEGDNISLTSSDTEINIEVEPSGSNTQIQYNNNGTLGGDSGFTTDGAGTVSISGSLEVDDLTLNGVDIGSIGAITFTAGGTNSSITLTPSGSGQVLVPNTYAVTNDYSLTTKTYVEGRFSDIDANNLGETVGREGLYVNKIDDVLQLKSLVEGDNISLTSDANEVTITANPSGTNTQIQYNNNGVFGADANFTTNGSGTVDITGSLDVDDINIDGSTISTTATDANLTLSPNGDGQVLVLNTYVVTDDYSLTTKDYVEDRVGSIDGANLAGDQGLFTSRSTDTLQFKSISAGDNIELTATADAVTIIANPSGATTQIQYNNNGAFGADSNFTTNGTGTVDITGSLDVDDVKIDGTTVSTTSTNGNLTLAPNGTGQVSIDGVRYSKRQTATLGASGTLFSYTGAGNEGTWVDFIAYRSGVGSKMGTLYIAFDGATESIADAGAETGDVGLAFTASTDTGTVSINYTATSGTTIAYSVKQIGL